MALPSGTGYDTNIVPAPDGDVENFTFIKGGSDFSPEFLADINTGDGTRARFAWDIDEGEMAFDWIADDVQVDPGVIRIGAGRIVYAASSDAARTVRSYAPNTRNTAYAATDTYGQYNAYGSYFGTYWHNLNDLEDRTGNTEDLTLTGTGIEEITGPVGGAVRISDLTTYFTTTQSVITSGIEEHALMSFIRQNGAILTVSELLALNGAANLSSHLKTSNGIATFNTRRYVNASVVASFDDDVWTCLAGRQNGASSRDLLVDGVIADTETTAISNYNLGSTSVDIGNLSYTTDGNTLDIGPTAIISGAPSDDWFAYERSQTSDNSTFWGTAVWITGDTGTAFDGGIEQGQTIAGAIKIKIPYTGGIEQNQTISGALSIIGADADFTGGISQGQAVAGALKIKTLFTGGVEQSQEISGQIEIIAAETNFTGGISQAQKIGGEQKIVLSFAGGVEQGQTVAGTLRIVGADTNFQGGVTQEQEISGQITVEDNRITLTGGIVQGQEIAGEFTVVLPPAAFTGGSEQTQEVSGHFGYIVEITPVIITVPGEIERSITISGIITRSLTIKGELV